MSTGKGWNGQAVEWRGSLVRADGNITVGVCAREQKALSKHMVAITSRLNPSKFEVTCDHYRYLIISLMLLVSCRSVTAVVHAATPPKKIANY